MKQKLPPSQSKIETFLQARPPSEIVLEYKSHNLIRKPNNQTTTHTSTRYTTDHIHYTPKDKKLNKETIMKLKLVIIKR